MPGYTLREIGEYLQLNPDYLSRIIGKIRKTSEGRLVPPSCPP